MSVFKHESEVCRVKENEIKEGRRGQLRKDRKTKRYQMRAQQEIGRGIER